MDVENNYTEFDDVDQNGTVQGNHDLGAAGVSEVVNQIHGCSMVAVDPDPRLETVSQPFAQDVEKLTDGHVKTNVTPALEEIETEESKELKQQKIQGREKSAKSSSIKNPTGVSIKKSNLIIESKGTLDGSVTAKTRPKQPAVKTKSFKDRDATNSDLSKSSKLKPATSNALKDKLPKSAMMPGSDQLVQSEGSIEKSTLKLLGKVPATHSEGDGGSVESATIGDAKSQKAGKLPSYGFSFRCHERAEKRKEFYTKLEERIHAQEIEKNNQQVKSKESQQAEIRMLRKSLNFKATPMPTFYQEPSPPKVELKKIPITRPRSPKLGRKNSSSMKKDGDQTHGPARHSLYEKVVSISQPKLRQGPQRKSLPRLPSEKTRFPKNGPEATVAGTAPTVQIVDGVSLPTSKCVPIAHIDDVETQVPDLGSVPIARVEEGDPDLDQVKVEQ